jgi:hypothetical protein
MGSKADNSLLVQCGGKNARWGLTSGGFTGDFAPAADGSTILAVANGSSLAIDFSGASGADAMLVQTGPGAQGEVVEVAGTKVAFGFFGGGKPAKPQVLGDKVTVGEQTVTVKDGKIVLGKFGR